MNESMLDRLVSMENRYEELGHMLMDPDIGTDIKKMTDVTKEQASLQAAYDLFQEYKEVKDGIDGAKELMKENDPEIKEMAKMELDELEAVRLADYEGKSQIETGEIMNVSRGTVQRLLASGRKKIMDGFLHSKAIKLKNTYSNYTDEKIENGDDDNE